ncbi:MAG: [Fe-Fe] hydrogenase large subunit C-terminal domain-containing protein [Halanaerobiales bacterium]
MITITKFTPQDLQKLRKKLFRLTVKHTLQNDSNIDINSLPEIINQKNNNVPGPETVKRELLPVIGLSPDNYDQELSTALDTALKLDEIEKPVVTVNESLCENCDKKNEISCVQSEEERGLMIEYNRCISCGKCIPRCPLRAISDKIEFVPMARYLKEDKPVYAHVAPAVVGQFGEEVTPGKLRSALKSIGFTDMIEVALFADIITIHEADEYINLVQDKDDFLITSCCCPVWLNLLNNHYPELSEKLTQIVSPMIASGRVIKAVFPEAITVFIGPCIAKKSEAKEEGLKGAIDYVLTFEELAEVFSAMEINPAEMDENQKEQSSCGGRIYARTGGVSQAVEVTLEELEISASVDFKPAQADGIQECKKLLDKLQAGNLEANFIEGMGCEGGCVGGPKRNINPEKGKAAVENFAYNSRAKNPLENKNVAYILRQLDYLYHQEKQWEELELKKLLLRE